MRSLHTIASEEERQDDYCGKTFERWTVIEFAGWTKNRLRLYKARCSCLARTEKVVYKCALDRGQSRSCGCLAAEEASKRSTIDVSGQRFGKLVAKEIVGKTRYGNLWRCECDCGVDAIVLATSLTGKVKKTRSCGCLIAESAKTRIRRTPTGQRVCLTAEWKAWQRMKGRCKPTHEAHDRYYDKGIRVCEAWEDDFGAFLEYIGPMPAPGYTIDRIENTKGYEPGNVRWATETEQNQNKGDNLVIIAGGKGMSRAEWAREVGLEVGDTGIGYSIVEMYRRMEEKGLKIDWSGKRRDMPYQVDPRTKEVVALPESKG